jgi:hypothetical protein
MSDLSSFPLFDSIASDAAASAGIEQAAVNKNLLLEEARAIAVEIGRARREVTADDVIRVYSFRHPREPLGNAAGGIFKGPQWRFAGRYVKSERVSAHSRMIRVWEYIGK